MSNQVYSNDLQKYSLDVPNINCDSIQFGDGSLFQSYIQSGYTAAVTGPITASTAGLYRKLDRIAVISCSQVLGTSTAATNFTFTNLLPHSPFANMTYPIWVKDNGVDSVGTLQISTGGQMTIYKGLNSNFTGSGQCGFQPFTVTFCCFE